MNRTKPLSRGSGPKRGSPKRTQPKRFWDDAREKVTSERVCRLWRLGGCQGKVECAHVIGREKDPPADAYGATGYDRYVEPVSVIPLCQHHHREYDARRVDVLHVLDLREQLQAVADAGSVELMRRRTAPTAYRRAA